MLVRAPGPNGPAVIQELVSRAGIREDWEESYSEITEMVNRETEPTQIPSVCRLDWGAF